MSETRESQFKVLLTDEAQKALEDQRLAVGFHSANASAAVVLTAFSAIPPERFFEVLALISKYKKPSSKYPRKY